MNPETNPIKVYTPLGPLHIAVIGADEETYYEHKRGHQTDIRPRVRVATDPTFEADPDHPDHWTIRRRAYAVHRTFFFEDRTHVVYDNGVNAGRWHHETAPYRGGYRNDRRGQVEFGTKTYDLMDKTVTAALDEFAADYPEWADFSVYLLLANKRDRAHTESTELRRQAAEAERRAAEMDKEAQPYLDRVSDDLAALIRG